MVAEPGRLTVLASARPEDAAVIIDRLGRYGETAVTWGPYRLSRNPMYISLILAYLGEAKCLDQLAGVGRVGVERRVQIECLIDSQPLGQLAGLQLYADQPGQLTSIRDRVGTENPDRAPVRRAESGDAFDGGGLAGAVGAEDPEDLTPAYAQ